MNVSNRTKTGEITESWPVKILKKEEEEGKNTMALVRWKNNHKWHIHKGQIYINMMKKRSKATNF